MSEDFGLKISKPGQDVNTATDANMHYSSKFNILKVAKSELVDVLWNGTSHTATTTEVVHGLNFTPTFLAYIEANTNKWMGTGADATNISDVDYVSLEGYSDATTLYLTPTVSSFSTRYNTNLTLNVYYFIFGDTARETSTQTNVLAGRNIGMKIMKTGKDTSSKYIEDMLFDSEMSSMMIALQGSTSITGGGTTTVAHGLGYKPAFLVMVSNDNATFYLSYFNPNVSGPSAYGWVDGTNLNLRSFNGGGQTHYFRYIIFVNKLAA